ncbi:GAF domain-containing protein [Sabulilitoribacter multivorans]|uniref:GAF domain-containing protein n=1 Tax=Flaviramulus multivorans TaxID=1304750 RepID=A0ABS9IKZ4_9FLAO|nr:GAF domain-containing protein [Flaviramulus multivorans]MCF7561251.1 GAF domain-containing protein [Flaviramulus multivorans]
MDVNDDIESPLKLKISFNRLLEHYETMSDSEDEFIANKANKVLEIAKKHPELRDGFSDVSLLKTREKEIQILLQDTFSPLLTKNEIKTASVPLHDLIFNSSERFKNIIKTAGGDFELQIKNMPQNDMYIMACTIILNFCYGYNLNFKRPFYYQIPDENGILRYYKILYNADFCEIIPTDNAPKITKEDYDELLDNFDNIEIWKEKFPPHSYLFKGFVISNIFDVTDDQSISNIKSNLIIDETCMEDSFADNFRDIFSSLFGIKDVKVGFSIYNKEDDTFEKVHGIGANSFLINNADSKECKECLCSWSYERLLKENKYFSVSDVDKLYKISKGKAPHIVALHEQGIKSAIFAPIANEQGLMGILEIVSYTPQELNSINANKLLDVMPFIVSAVERSTNEEENLIEAIIQQECTSIHPSVSWKFKQAAKKFLIDSQKNQIEKPSFSKIAFDNVYPLFGQIDVKGSSDARNLATQKDLALQLTLVDKILDIIPKNEELPIYEQLKFQIEAFNQAIKADFKVDTEHELTRFFKEEIEPLFIFFLEKKDFAKEEIEDYFSKVDTNLNVIYYYRKNYDDTIALINKNMSALLDHKQIEAQNMYPHFFERFKTDGVEHNMYIGESITKEESFNTIYLYNLRLWQLQVMYEMENDFYQNQDEYPIGLDVASMILVFNQPLSIRFRMDEKQFDVDGTYNARYEVVKKRVDKAFIKGTEERVTQKGKMSIIYSQKEDEIEYLKYVRFMQSKKMFDDDVEILELQDLQGVTGLKAIRVSMIYHKNNGNDNVFYTYDDLMKEIKA